MTHFESLYLSNGPNGPLEPRVSLAICRPIFCIIGRQRSGRGHQSAPWSILPATEPTGNVALGLPVVGPPSFRITSLDHRSSAYTLRASNPFATRNPLISIFPAQAARSMAGFKYGLRAFHEQRFACWMAPRLEYNPRMFRFGSQDGPKTALFWAVSQRSITWMTARKTRSKAPCTT
jgi:hypothetical protein